MTYEMNKVHRYRKQAKQLRIFASMDGQPKTAGMLREVAADYDGLADMFAAMDRANLGIQ